MKNAILLILPLIFVYGCGSPQSSNNNKENNCSESSKSAKISSQAEKSTSEKSTADRYTMVWVERDFESGYSYSIMLQSYKDNMTVGERKVIDLSSYGGDVMHDQYHSAGPVGIPVQLNKDLTKAYCSIVKNDELEAEFYWAKLVEVQISNGVSKVIAEFDGLFPAWHYNEVNNTIYGYLPGKKQIIALNVESGERTTIKQFQNSQDAFNFYPQNDGSITIISQSAKKEVFKHLLSPENNSLTSTLVANTDHFSSYNNGFAIETYKDWGSDMEELRIYSGGEIKASVPFNFKNFNTFWVNQNEFVCTKDDMIVKMNTKLKQTGTFKKKNIHIIDDLDNSLFITYGDHSNKTAALLSDNFGKVKIINDINPDDIIALIKQ